MTAKESIERRFLVTEPDPGIMDYVAEHGDRIRQGFWPTPPTETMFLQARLAPDGRVLGGTMRHKRGVGPRRDVHEREFEASHAEWLLERCPLQVDKTRFALRHWKIDRYHAPLEGLVVAEWIVEDPSAPLALPPWARKSVEVTDSLTSYHLALVAAELRQTGSVFHQGLVLAPPMPRIVLTGGPCSGKSTIMTRLREEFGGVLHCVPEVATIVIGQLGIIPPAGEPIAQLRFQQTIAEVQRSFEEAASAQAVRDGKKAVLEDRGMPDQGAYLEGGRDGIVRMLGTSLEYELSRYELVLCLEVPPQEAYEANKGNNAARRETWEEASTLGFRIKLSWEGHPGLVIVGNDGGWAAKQTLAIEIVRAFLASLDRRPI